jgi:hypothetical protein
MVLINFIIQLIIFNLIIQVCSNMIINKYYNEEIILRN